MFKIQERIQRNTNDILITLTEEEEKFRIAFSQSFVNDSNNWICTICNENIDQNQNVFPHPALTVVICFKCFSKYETSTFSIYKDGTDMNCRWCANLANKYCCSQCTVVFCKDCIIRNLGHDFVQNKLDLEQNWKCFICDPKQVWRLRAIFFESNKTTPSNYSQESHLAITPKKEVCRPIQESNGDTCRDETSSVSVVNSQETSSTMDIPITPKKKKCLPIPESDDENEKPEKNNNKAELSLESREEALQNLNQIVDKFTNFISTFSDRVDMFRNRFCLEKIKNYDDVSKFVSKISDFCDLAKNNMDLYKMQNELKFEEWKEQNSHVNNAQSINDNGEMIIDNNDSEKENNLNSDNLLPINMTENFKKKYNLSLNPNSQSSEDAVIDNASPNSFDSFNNFLDNVKVKISNDKTNCAISSDKLPEQIQNSADVTNVINDTKSVTSDKTIIRNSFGDDIHSLPTQIIIKQEPVNGESLSEDDRETIPVNLNLPARIMEDFNDESQTEESIKQFQETKMLKKVQTKEILCDRTGYYVSYDVSSSLSDSVTDNVMDWEDFESDVQSSLSELSFKMDFEDEIASNINQSVFAEILEAKTHDFENTKEKIDDDDDVEDKVDEKASSDYSARERAYKDLISSADESNYLTSDSEKSCKSSLNFKSDETVKFEFGYIRELNIQDELEKLRNSFQNNPSTSVEIKQYPETTPCTVSLEKVDFAKCYGITKIENSNSYQLINNDEAEIRR